LYKCNIQRHLANSQHIAMPFQQQHDEQLPTKKHAPYVSGDRSALSLSYLAQISAEVYDDCDDRAATKKEQECPGGNSNSTTTTTATKFSKERITCIQVVSDKFSIYETTTPTTATSAAATTNTAPKKTLFVAICGTSSPLQHIMNVMPHAYSGFHAIERAFTTNNTTRTTNASSSADRGTSTAGNTGTAFETQEEAYRAGHREGWIEPAEDIYREIVRWCCSNNSNENENNRDAWNAAYDRIVVTGHSRGGLLAYYVGWLLVRGGIATTNTIANVSDNDNKNENTNESSGHGSCTAISPFRGLLKVVGFGMPSPLCEPTENTSNDNNINDTFRSFVSEHVVSVWNRNDPVANGSSSKLSSSIKPRADSNSKNNPWWNPVSVRVGKIKRPAASTAKTEIKTGGASSSMRGGSGFWGLVGNVVSVAVEAVGDKAAELATDVDKHHGSLEYFRQVSNYKRSDNYNDTTTTNSNSSSNIASGSSSSSSNDNDLPPCVIPQPVDSSTTTDSQQQQLVLMLA